MDQLAVDLYDELRLIARRLFRRERRRLTVQPTAIIHEAFLRLRGAHQLTVNDRVHFARLAARVMRRILAERARRRRGSGPTQIEEVTLTDRLGHTTSWSVDLADLDRALRKLREENPRDADIVELRYFGGLTHGEIAGLLGVSVSTVEKSWRFARSRLFIELGPPG
ncbi:MAG: sigma-70 family RNA polymerase sigma factor [Candidatus Eisenbacteria bacterium]|nr:sigma-70 family RNA polymerase sigma factor [Candidatus Eisenbacteria bacterium]